MGGSFLCIFHFSIVVDLPDMPHGCGYSDGGLCVCCFTSLVTLFSVAKMLAFVFG